MTATRTFEIVNLDTNKLEAISPTTSSLFPLARGFHQVMKFGKILFLYGGIGSKQEILSDMWKLVIKTRSWIHVQEDSEKKFYLPRADYVFTKLQGNERPVIFGGQNRNGDYTNDLILIDFDVCLSDEISQSEYKCLPCSEGYVLSENKKCVQCEYGFYHDINNEDYSKSTCKTCPVKAYNNHLATKGLHSCKLCGFGFYNYQIGREHCQKCPVNEICLPGSEYPSKANYLFDKVNKFYLKEENYPDFISSNRVIKENWQYSALILAFAMLTSLIILIFVLKAVFRKRISRILISLDFMPITGGGSKKLNGGILTIIYVYANIVLIAVFVMRYLYYNELIEVIPISSSHGSTLSSSYGISIDLVGYENDCINSNQKIDENYYLCSNSINISIQSNSGKTKDLSENKMARCQITPENICRINILCEDCKTLENGSSLLININNPNAYVQLFYWTFESVWGENMDYLHGYSKMQGVFKPDETIE